MPEVSPGALSTKALHLAHSWKRAPHPYPPRIRIEIKCTYPKPYKLQPIHITYEHWVLMIFLSGAVLSHVSTADASGAPHPVGRSSFVSSTSPSSVHSMRVATHLAKASTLGREARRTCPSPICSSALLLKSCAHGCRLCEKVAEGLAE